MNWIEPGLAIIGAMVVLMALGVVGIVALGMMLDRSGADEHFN